VKLYKFDGVSTELELLPVAARRALDHAGAKLSLDGFRSLELGLRRELCELGSGDAVDVERVWTIARTARPAADACALLGDPSSVAPPAELLSALSPARPLPDNLWPLLSPLDRYTLWKVTQRGNPERIEGAYREIVGQSAHSTHVGPAGGVRMVRVSDKAPSARRAVAESWVSMSQAAFERLESPSSPKGDVLGTARLAGILGAKRTSELIPLCHPLSLTHVEVRLETDAPTSRVRVLAEVEVVDRTGVEMEALVAASTAALTIYDMLKSVDRGMEIGPTRLLEKSGGRSGDFRAQEKTR
jgi:cyclic pyranopterin phosphate synthase